MSFRVRAEVKTEGEAAGAVLFSCPWTTFRDNHEVLREEVFGPSTLVIECTRNEEALTVIKLLGKKFLEGENFSDV